MSFLDWNAGGAIENLAHRIWKWAKPHVFRWLRYSIVTSAVLIPLYIPYQVYWIGLTGVQLVKWSLTAWAMGMVTNLIMAPWLAFAFRRKWLK